MRPTRATFLVLSAAMVTAVFGSGCTSPGETVVATDLGLTDVVIDGNVAPGLGASDVNDLSLRTPGQGETEQAVPGEVTGRPSPPTLSESPVLTSPAITSTIAPTTSVPTTPETTTTTQPTTASTTAPSSTDAPKQTDSTPESSGSSTTAPGAGAESGEAHSFTLLNDLRTGLALTPLARVAEMDTFARDWSRQMAESGRFEHSTGPYGENIAFTSNTGLSAAQAAELFHQLWIDSPSHYANMTNDQYASTGVGLYLTERGWYGTHVFNF